MFQKSETDQGRHLYCRKRATATQLQNIPLINTAQLDNNELTFTVFLASQIHFTNVNERTSRRNLIIKLSIIRKDLFFFVCEF